MANKIFEIEITETLCRVVKIRAKSFENALLKIQRQYALCEIILDYNDFVEVSYQDINKESIEDEKNRIILEILDYMYIDEKRHFVESDCASKQNHIFTKLERLNRLCRG